MELDTIKLQTTWNDAVESLNNNFAKLKQAAASSGVATYIHKQSEASSKWTIEHNLGRNPSVTIVDSAGTEVYGDVQYVNDNVITVSFSAPFGGKAYLN